jgi:antitoxin PrlF
MENDRLDNFDQAWFWTPEWQAGERETDEDIKAGHYKDFATIYDLLADLNDETIS